MIIKHKTEIQSRNAKEHAGNKQELDVAYFLEREFTKSKNVFVFNDLKLEFDGAIAQIDHLIVYEKGFVLIESKSIKGNLQVNKAGEWTRSYNNEWFGMPSPLAQVELQGKVLKAKLNQDSLEFLPPLLGGIRQKVSYRKWAYLCVVSSDAIINRDGMPDDISERLIKTEFLVKKLREIIGGDSFFSSIRKTLSTDPIFDIKSMQSMSDYLVRQHIGADSEPQLPKIVEKVTMVKQEPIIAKSGAGAAANLNCRHCDSDDVKAIKGRYGYYLSCQKCKQNTQVKRPCPSCRSKDTSVKKVGSALVGSCKACVSTYTIFTEQG